MAATENSNRKRSIRSIHKLTGGVDVGIPWRRFSYPQHDPDSAAFTYRRRMQPATQATGTVRRWALAAWIPRTVPRRDCELHGTRQVSGNIQQGHRLYRLIYVHGPGMHGSD